MRISKCVVLLLCALLCTSPTWAARGFGTTDGAATTDRIVTTYGTHNTLVSWSFWLYRTGNGGGGSNAIVYHDTFVRNIWYDTAGTQYRFVVGWTTDGGIWSIAAPATGGWNHVVITYDGGSTSNDPVIYLNGSSATVTEHQAPVGTLRTDAGAYTIGNFNDGLANFNGRIAEVAIWNGTLLSAGDVTLLWNSGAGRRADTLTTAPSFYMKLCGTASPEPQEIVGVSTGTLTGTATQTHPFANCATSVRGLSTTGVGN